MFVEAVVGLLGLDGEFPNPIRASLNVDYCIFESERNMLLNDCSLKSSLLECL